MNMWHPYQSEDSNDSCSFAVGSLIIDIDAQIDGPRNPQLSSSQKMNSKPVVEANKANNVEKAKADGAGKPTSLKNNNEHELGPKKTNKPLENGDKARALFSIFSACTHSARTCDMCSFLSRAHICTATSRLINFTAEKNKISFYSRDKLIQITLRVTQIPPEQFRFFINLNKEIILQV